LSAKQEGHVVGIVEITDENKNALLDIALSSYLGERCKYCGKEYTSLEMLKDTVWAGYHKNGRLACSACWKKHEDQRKLISVPSLVVVMFCLNATMGLINGAYGFWYVLHAEYIPASLVSAACAAFSFFVAYLLRPSTWPKEGN
jgi:hypothetical protein